MFIHKVIELYLIPRKAGKTQPGKLWWMQERQSEISNPSTSRT